MLPSLPGRFVCPKTCTCGFSTPECRSKQSQKLHIARFRQGQLQASSCTRPSWPAEFLIADPHWVSAQIVSRPAWQSLLCACTTAFSHALNTVLHSPHMLLKLASIGPDIQKSSQCRAMNCSSAENQCGKERCTVYLKGQACERFNVNPGFRSKL